MELKDVKHVLWLAYILLGAAAAALIVRAQFIPPSFGRYGAYRGDSVKEIMDMPKRYRGVEDCKSCHEQQWNEWRKSVHKSVACESCHGPGTDHSEPDVYPRPKIFGTKELMSQSHDLCLSCHAKTPGRPEQFPQVDSASHIARYNITEKGAGGRGSGIAGSTAVSAEEDKAEALPEEYSCMFCHGKEGTLAGSEGSEHLIVTPEHLATDVHWRKGLRCHDCHGGSPTLDEFVNHRDDAGFRSVADREKIPEFCGHCHFNLEFMRRRRPSDAEQFVDYLANRHGRLVNQVEGQNGAVCIFCHGHHSILPATDLGEPYHCVACHKGHTPLR